MKRVISKLALALVVASGCNDAVPRVGDGSVADQCGDVKCPIGSTPSCMSDLIAQCEGGASVDVLRQDGKIVGQCGTAGGVNYVCLAPECSGDIVITETRTAAGDETKRWSCMQGRQPDMGTPDLDMGTPDPDMSAPDPDMGTPDPDMSAPDPDMSAPDPDMGAPDPDMGAPDPDMGTPECGGGAGADEHGIEWVCVPSGSFHLGREDGPDDERPQRLVHLREFLVSKTEVTVAQYRRCVEAGVCRAPTDVQEEFLEQSCNYGRREGHPMNCITPDEANDFVVWVGDRARLPSESEWEYVATSGGTSTWPWGDGALTRERAVYLVEGSSFNTELPCSTGPSLLGVCDISGNVFEWVSDWYGGYETNPGDGSPQSQEFAELLGPDMEAKKVYRGGSFLSAAQALGVKRRDHGWIRSSHSYIGFRLARDVE